MRKSGTKPSASCSRWAQKTGSITTDTSMMIIIIISSSSSSSRRLPLGTTLYLKWTIMRKGGGSSVLRKLIREATTRGWDVRFGKYRDYSIRGFRPMIHAGSSLTGSTFQCRHHGEVILRCRRWWTVDDHNKRSCWEWQPFTGAMTDLPRQIREQLQAHRQRMDVALKRAAKRVRR